MLLEQNSPCKRSDSLICMLLDRNYGDILLISTLNFVGLCNFGYYIPLAEQEQDKRTKL